MIERRTTDRWWVPLALRKGTIAPSIDVPTVTIPIPSIKCLKFKQLNVLVLVVHSHSLFEAKVSIQCDAVVAVIVVRIVFISSFFFYCLLLNHSFPKNPNSVTNCFKLILSIYNFTNYICSMRSSILIFLQSQQQLHTMQLQVQWNRR